MPGYWWPGRRLSILTGGASSVWQVQSGGGGSPIVSVPKFAGNKSDLPQLSP
jgi:hypothetical protein